MEPETGRRLAVAQGEAASPSQMPVREQGHLCLPFVGTFKGQVELSLLASEGDTEGESENGAGDLQGFWVNKVKSWLLARWEKACKPIHFSTSSQLRLIWEF